MWGSNQPMKIMNTLFSAPTFLEKKKKKKKQSQARGVKMSEG